MGEFETAIVLGTILLITSFTINLFLKYLQTRYRPDKGKRFKVMRFGD
jgi:ABC-type sulfate transport system permease component